MLIDLIFTARNLPKLRMQLLLESVSSRSSILIDKTSSLTRTVKFSPTTSLDTYLITCNDHVFCSKLESSVKVFETSRLSLLQDGRPCMYSTIHTTYGEACTEAGSHQATNQRENRCRKLILNSRWCLRPPGPGWAPSRYRSRHSWFHAMTAISSSFIELAKFADTCCKDYLSGCGTVKSCFGLEWLAKQCIGW